LCRSFLGQYFNKYGEEVIDSRNNLGVITLSPLLCALRAKGDIKEFWKNMEDAVDIVKEGLMYRISRFENVTSDAAPILYQNGSLNVNLKRGEKVSDIFKNGFSSISLGYVGLWECVLYLTGENPYESEKAYNLKLEILKYLDRKTIEWKEETGYGFKTYATPNESTSLRLVRKYKEDFGEIRGVTDHVYLTNSFHLFPEQAATAFEKIEYEAPFIPYTSGGFVTTVDMVNMESNPVAHEELIDYAYDKVPYFLINQPVDECYKCEFTGELVGTSEGYHCPNCMNNEVGTLVCIRRVSGYISEPDTRPFNQAKQEEVIHRVKHM